MRKPGAEQRPELEQHLIKGKYARPNISIATKKYDEHNQSKRAKYN